MDCDVTMYKIAHQKILMIWMEIIYHAINWLIAYGDGLIHTQQKTT